MRSCLLLCLCSFLLPLLSCQAEATVKKSASPQTFARQASQTAPREQAAEKRYWVTRSSGKTHNSHCRYYANSKGYYSSTGTGNNCKFCGGAAR